MHFLLTLFLPGADAFGDALQGLGKTVQTIAFISALLGKKGDHRDRAAAVEAAAVSMPPPLSDKQQQQQQQCHIGRLKVEGVPVHVGASTQAAACGQAADALRTGVTAAAAEAAERVACGQAAVASSQVTAAEAAVATAAAVRRYPILVVSPTSVIDNWMRELRTWGSFRAAAFRGTEAVSEQWDVWEQ